MAQVRIPELLLQPFVMLGQATIPIMLISLGYRLHQVESRATLSAAPCYAFSAVLPAASIAVYLIGAEGVNRQVLLLYGSLPSAVVNFILTEKYRRDQAWPLPSLCSAL